MNLINGEKEAARAGALAPRHVEPTCVRGNASAALESVPG